MDNNMNVSIICACKNRYDSLSVSLTSWLKHEYIKEIIIVDWSSDVSFDHITEVDDRIKLIKVNDQKYFNQPQPLNLAINFASGDYILKLDADYIINPYHNFFESYPIDETTFVSGHHDIDSIEYIDPETGLSVVNFSLLNFEEIRNYVNSYSHYFKYLTGLLFISKKNLLSIGGYNENLGKYYAFEDDEICKRLEIYGLTHKKIKYDHTLIHIPHSDKKRFENFLGFSEKEKQYLNSFSEGEKKWQYEYFISQSHIKQNAKLSGEIKDYYVSPKTKWNIIKMEEQIYQAERIIDTKLYGLPTVHYVSLEESEERRNNLEKQFEFYGISTKGIISKKFCDSNDIITGKYVDQLNDGTKGCAVSHLKAIKEWYETTNDDYGFFCEDDLSLDTVNYWDFTWDQFIESVPEDAECVQLLTIRDEFDTFEIRERYWNDWGATAYIITRDYAKKIIDTFIIGESYKLEVGEIQPLIENILFASVGKTYTVPLFVEEINFNSTFTGDDFDVKNGQKNNHYIAHDLVLNWWKNKNKKLNSQRTELEELLYRYSLDTENPEHNFNLGIWYESQGHTAPALSYYLRCAERGENKDLVYEALIRGSYCYDKQGTRDGSAKSLLEQALCFHPTRPEAYFLLSRFAERRQWWQDCYIHADRALNYCSFDHLPLKTNVEYPGKYGLLFEKSIAAWWWGKVDEFKQISLDLKTNYDLDLNYSKAVDVNLEKAGINVQDFLKDVTKKFSLYESFDWGTLTHEDIITIQREIDSENVYSFWRSVQENDIVMDIGSSVGPFVCSIMKNKPKKVYCIEPSGALLETLKKNVNQFVPHEQRDSLVYINKAIIHDLNQKVNIFGGENDFEVDTFQKIIEQNSIDKINFLKIDCEGGEYSIFTEENMNFLLNRVDFIAMEVHLNYPGCREKFKNFRNKFLTQFDNFKVMSCTRQNISWGNSIDIKDRIFDDKFIDDYTCEFMIYISNKNSQQ
jgi:FkbM family methyltransferase